MGLCAWLCEGSTQQDYVGSAGSGGVSEEMWLPSPQQIGERIEAPVIEDRSFFVPHASP